MKKTELQEIADKLANEYGSDRHFEIINAAKLNDGWQLTVRAVKNEEAENDSNK